MKLKISIFKLLFSITTISALVTSSTTIISCSHKSPTNPISWSNFKNSATNETAINIVKASNVNGWQNSLTADLALNNFQVDKVKQTINVTINNKSVDATARFSITYKDNLYNLDQWVCNYNTHYRFSTHPDIPKKYKTQWIQQLGSTIFIIVSLRKTHNSLSIYLYHSCDDGKTFSKNSEINPNLEGISKLIKFGNTIFLATQKSSNEQYNSKTFPLLYSSHDGGKTFIPNSQIPNYGGVTDIIQIKNRIFIIWHSNYGDDQRLIYSSIDEGKTFEITLKIPNDGIVQKLVSVNNVIYIFGAYLTIYISYDGGKTFTKNPAFKVIKKQFFGSKAIVYFNKNIYLSFEQQMFISSDQGKTFHKRNFIDKINNIQLFNNTIYVSTDGGLYTLTANQKDFVRNSIIPSDHIVRKVLLIGKMIFVYVYEDHGSWYRRISTFVSWDDGKTFSRINIIPPGTEIEEIVLIKDTIYLWINNTKNDHYSQLYTTTLAIKKITKKISNDNLINGNRNVLSQNTLSIGNDIFMTFNGSLYISHDNGQHWKKKNSQNFNYYIFKINNNIYITTDQGLLINSY